MSKGSKSDWRKVDDLPSDVPHWNSLEQAIKEVDNWDSNIYSVRHILQLEDGTLIWMGHINCEHCYYCGENNRKPSLSLDTKHCISGPHQYQSDPYRDQRSY